jgi:NADH-ubiquinone oxidoreductase chain 4
MEYTYIIFLIGVITIVYASLSTLRTIDIKELIAYSSVSHAAVYLLGVFSNSIQGIEGAITLGLAHGFVSPGLFICAGGVLYDRSHTRVISFYRGVTQVMPLFAILFFILCLANCGAPLTLNFIGEFLSLYGVFERSSLYGLFASSSIIFSAAYTIYMFQRIAFGGAYSRMFTVVMPDLTKREYTILMILVVPTVLLGIYPASILDGLGYAVSLLLYSSDIASHVVPNTQEFFSAGIRMLKSDAHIPRDTTPDFEQETEVPQEEPTELTAQERIEGDFDNCRGPRGTGEQAGEPVDPDYEGDHTFTESSPQNHEPITGGSTDSMCEACERTLEYATDTFVTCITCDSSWCQACTTLIENISG